MATEYTDARDHEFEEIVDKRIRPSQNLSIEDLKDARLNVTAELGRCRMLVREVLELRSGSVVTLDKLAGEMTDLYVNGLHFARGEVIPLGDTLHVRIGEVLGMPDKTEKEDKTSEQPSDE